MQHLSTALTLITGASSGIGRACAELFAQEGSRLLLLSRRRQQLEELAYTLHDRFGSQVRCIECDLRDRQHVIELWNALPEQWRTVDILINNAGLARGLAPLFEGSFEDWDEMIDTNIRGLLTLTRLVLPGMVQRGTGFVINIGSIAGRQVYPNGNVYCATKHAVRALSQALQLELCGTGVRVTNIDPGMVETEFSLVRFRGDVERARAVYSGMQPLTPHDVAEVALFCATRPPHVSIQDVLVMPADQASATVVHRRMTD